MSNVIKSDCILWGEGFALDPEINAPKILITTVGEEQLIERISPVEQIRLEAEAQAQTIVAQGEAQVAVLRAEMEAVLAKEREETLEKAYQTGNGEGYTDGYDAGFKQGVEDAIAANRAAADELKAALEAFEAESQRILADSMDDLKNLALEIAGKVINQRISDNRGVYLNMIEEALDTFRAYSWVDIYVSEEEQGLAAYIESSLAENMAKKSKYLKVREKAGRPLGTCIVETDAGVVDASTAVQLAQIEKLLQDSGD